MRISSDERKKGKYNVLTRVKQRLHEKTSVWEKEMKGERVVGSERVAVKENGQSPANWQQEIRAGTLHRSRPFY